MSNPNLDQSSDIGGATGSALSVPQIRPVFSYRVSGGEDINVYFVQTKGAKIVIMTYGDPPNEYAYSTLTLFSDTGYEAGALVFDASRHWGLENNPFLELENDTEAMERLSKLLSQFHEGE
jgi:hypothetical protein